MTLFNGGDPFIETPRLDIFPTYFKIPFFVSKKYLVLRLSVMGLFFLHLISLGSQTIAKATSPLEHFDADDRWLHIVKIILIFTTMIPNALMCVQTLLTCVVGFDKIYVTQPLAWALTRVFVLTQMLIRCYKYSKWNQEAAILKGVQAFFYSIAIVLYLVFNLKTRILYIYQYREAIERTNSYFSELFRRLLIPIVIMIFFQLLMSTIKICAIRSRKHDRIMSAEFASTACHLLMRTGLITYELYMYLCLSSKKLSWRYLLSNKTSKYERIFMAVILTSVTISLTFITIDCLGYHDGYDKRKPMRSQPTIVVAIVICVYMPLVRCMRWIGMWYYALEVWNVNDLSWNSFELSIMSTESETFEGAEPRIVTKKRVQGNGKRVRFASSEEKSNTI